MPVFDPQASLAGHFHSLDTWLSKIGFTAEEAARIPTATSITPKKQDVQTFLLDPLKVQKPERLHIFNAKHGNVVTK